MPANKLITLPPNFIAGSSSDFRQWLKYKRLSDDLSNVTPDDVMIDDEYLPVVKHAPVIAKPRKPFLERRKRIVPDEMVAWIKAHQPCTVSTISQGLGMNESTVINRVKQLEAKGLLDNYSDFADSRHSRPSKFYTVKERVSA